MAEVGTYAKEEAEKLIREAKAQIEQSKRLVFHSRMALAQTKALTEQLKAANPLTADLPTVAKQHT